MSEEKHKDWLEDKIIRCLELNCYKHIKGSNGRFCIFCGMEENQYHDENCPLPLIYKKFKDDEQRIKELEEALRKYGEHLPRCEMVWKEEEPRTCNCGLEQVLKGNK